MGLGSHLKLELSINFCSTNWPLNPAQGVLQSVTKFTAFIVVNLATPKAAAQHELLFIKPAPETSGQFVGHPGWT